MREQSEKKGTVGNRMEDVRVCCIGSGVMGGALMRAVCAVLDPSSVTVCDADAEKARAFAAELGCRFAETNAEAVRGATHVFLAVKPVSLDGVLADIGKNDKTRVFVSMAAGVSLERLSSSLGRYAKIIRIMPNLPATVGEGMIALSPGGKTGEADTETVKALLEKAGRVETVPERLMDGVTAVSGSGPAYAFLFVEALADAAVMFGIPRAQALVYAAQTLKGAAAMVLEQGTHPAVLKDAVCSPAGTTIEAVASLEQNGFRFAVIEAARAAYEKSVLMGK